MRSSCSAAAEKGSGVMGAPVVWFVTLTFDLDAGTQKSAVEETLHPGSRPNCGEFKSSVPLNLRVSLTL